MNKKMEDEKKKKDRKLYIRKSVRTRMTWKESRLSDSDQFMMIGYLKTVSHDLAIFAPPCRHISMFWLP